MRIKIPILLTTLFSTFVASAQIDLPQSLRNPIERAMEKSIEIQNKNLDIEKAELERKAVVNKFIPKVDAVGGYAYLNSDVTIDIPTLTLPITGLELFEGKGGFHQSGHAAHAGVMAKTVLFSGGQITNGARALEQKNIGDRLLIETDRDNLIAEVVESFDALKLIEVSQKLIDESDKRLAKEEERVQKGIQNGLAIPFDRDKIKLARLTLESKKVTLNNTHQVLLQKIEFLTGMSAAEIDAVVYDLDPVFLTDNITAQNKPELKALDAYRQASEYVLKKEQSSYLPTIGAFAGLSYTGLYDMRMNNFSSWPAARYNPELKLNELLAFPSFTAGVVLKWEIFGGFERKNKADIARINIRQLENKKEDAREKLELLLNHKMANYHAQWQQILIANQQKVIAQNALHLAQRQYTEGLISITDRLAAESDFFAAEQQNVQAVINQRQAALDALKVTGEIYNQINFR